LSILIMQLVESCLRSAGLRGAGLRLSFRVWPALWATLRGTSPATATVAGGFLFPLADLGFMLLMPALELFHGPSLIEETEGDPPKEVLQIEDPFVGKDLPDRVCRLGALVEPFHRLLTIDLYSGGDGEGIVGAYLLDELAVPGGSCICDHDEVEGSFLASVSLQANFYSHKKWKFFVGGER